MIETDRLILRAFREEDRAPLAAINGDPRVGEWLGGAIDRTASDALLDRLNAEIARDGFGFFAAERKADGQLVGMIGIRAQKDAPPAPCLELGWRLAVEAQGQGYATEGARALLDWGFATQGNDEILAWTAASNLRSQAVMRRIGMIPDPARDFDHPALAEDHPLRRHVVFVAKRP
ncbi:MAG: GNAT family N-acetyltransferase [Phenylobacterium sp.]|uniref:GNAT family N-acetyltransferase n=1 Tax=Phenylobacterium sp. TaxID=1871053 RepID=UPI001A27D2B1|nr:GNAT family N-acetyltransferase [Phenylobacterium sp.]MBJ7412239.1 GNAT family N-acetyltransferase [Phenylobacterium sp.]